MKEKGKYLHMTLLIAKDCIYVNGDSHCVHIELRFFEMEYVYLTIWRLL